MKTNCIAFVSAALLLGPWTPAFAAAVVTQRLSAASSAAEATSQPVRAIVFFQDQVDIEALDAALTASQASAAVRASTVINQLQAKANTTQARFRTRLARKTEAEVARFRSFWVCNAMMVEAVPSVLTELAQAPESPTWIWMRRSCTTRRTTRAPPWPKPTAPSPASRW